MTRNEAIEFFTDPANYTLSVFTDDERMESYQEYFGDIEDAINAMTEGNRQRIRRQNSIVKELLSSLLAVEYRMQTAAQLAKKEIAPIDWIVDKILPPGLCMIGAPSKMYKSFMALALCCAVSQGKPFFGYTTKKIDCLYMDLESSERRPRDRINLILGEGTQKPEGFYILTANDGVARIGCGFSEQVNWILKRHKDIRLIVVDVLQMIRQPARASQTGYDRDYEDFKELKALANKHNICILLIHHTRKMKDRDDVFNELSGSVGVMGALDCAWVISKDKRFDDEAILSITGRDLESQQFKIRFNKESFQWEMLGRREDIERQQLLDDYNESSVVQTIKRLLDINSGSWEGTAQELINASTYIKTYISLDAIRTAKEITRFTKQLHDDGIDISQARAGHRGTRTYKFSLFGNEFLSSASTALSASSASSASSADDGNTDC